MAPKHSITAIIFLVLATYYNNYVNAAGPAVFDIRNYGAKPGGDISKAFDDAWKAACNSSVPAKVFIAPGTWPLTQADVKGPCKSSIEIEVQGTLKADLDTSRMKHTHAWITVNYVENFKFYGGGVLDGQGHEAWKKNDCNKNKNCPQLPINLSMNFIKNSVIHDLTTKDSKNFHVNCISSENVTFQNFHISAPGDSPNTDGIHLGRSHNVKIIDSDIATGDDCVSIGDDSVEIHIENVKCGPGHGISVGSLGKNVQEKDVSGIYVKKCSFVGTDNGVRVKTWPSAPATLTITKLHFEDLTMDNVMFPIVIDQLYCPWNLCDTSSASKIKISDVKLNNIKGTSSTPTAVTLRCSSDKPCENVQVGDIDITYKGTQGNITTVCDNVKPTYVGKQNPPFCLTTSKKTSA